MILPVVQETDLRNQGKFFAEVHEDAFDYLTMLIQKSIGYFLVESACKPLIYRITMMPRAIVLLIWHRLKVGTDAANKDYVDGQY